MRVLLLLACLLAWPTLARAGEDDPATESATCTGEPAASSPTPAAAPVPAPRPGRHVHTRDLVLTLVLLATGALGVSAVARRERRLGHTLALRDPEAYTSGAALGVLVAVSLVAFGHVLGASGGVLALARGQAGWGVWTIVGVVLGGALSAWRRGTWRPSAFPEAGFAERYGRASARRFALAFVAAVLIEYAAAVAGGCTSGLALSGGVVLAPGAYLFMAAMFATGMATAGLVEWRARRGRRP